MALGYLHYEAHARTYITSGRVVLLGSWMNSDFFGEGAIISMMKDLGEQTGDTVVLAVRNGLHIQYIHVIRATSPAPLHMTLGTVRPLAASGAGFALLSTMTDTEVTRLVMRINAEAPEEQPLVKFCDLLEQLAGVRKRGMPLLATWSQAEAAIIAAPLPRIGAQQRMILGVGGISEVMRGRAEELSVALLSQIDKHCEMRGRDIIPIQNAYRDGSTQSHADPASQRDANARPASVTH